MITAMTLAFGAGLLATVNPCGFALLPGFLSLYLGAEESPSAAGARRVDVTAVTRLRQGFTVGLVLSGAFSAVFIVAGLVVTAGLRTMLTVIPWVAFAVGLVLVALGVAMLAGRRISLLAAGRLQPGVDQRTGYSRVAAFGVAYALASLSCTLAIFLVVVGQALTVSGVAQTLAVFAAYSAGSASVLLALSVSAALAKGALARGLRRLTPIVNRLAGGLLLASGLYLVAYWLPALGDGSATSGGAVARSSERVSSSLADFFAEQTLLFAVLLAALLVVGAAVLLRRSVADRQPN